MLLGNALFFLGKLSILDHARPIIEIRIAAFSISGKIFGGNPLGHRSLNAVDH
jgi:hypothetical protein